MSLKIGGHITYVRQEREAKDKPLKPVSYEATLLGHEAAENGKVGAARLVFFHPRGVAHLNSADWARAFEYAEQVPYEPEGEFFHGFSEPDESKKLWQLEAAVDQGSDALFQKDAEIAALQQTNTILNENVAQLTAKLAEIKGEPSAADLDAVVAEQAMVASPPEVRTVGDGKFPPLDEQGLPKASNVVPIADSAQA